MLLLGMRASLDGRSCKKALDRLTARDRRDGALPQGRERGRGVGVGRGPERVAMHEPFGEDAPVKGAPAPGASTASTARAGTSSRRSVVATRVPEAPSVRATTLQPSPR